QLLVWIASSNVVPIKILGVAQVPNEKTEK
ncbi:unnamed protein product, partial [marine sediment metagenome]